MCHTCRVSPHLFPLPLTTPMHFFHLKQERPQLLGRLASVEVRARPSRRRQADTEDRRMVASEVCNTARPLYIEYIVQCANCAVVTDCCKDTGERCELVESKSFVSL